MMNGKLIVIEGINGAGKTTIINELINYYNSVGRNAIMFKFPNRSGKFGSKIDKYLKGELKIESKYDIIDMFVKNRESELSAINDALKNNFIVICDRYLYSGIAYQIPSHVVDVLPYIMVLGYFDKKMPHPDMVYYIKGHHLIKRIGILPRPNKEIFHYINDNNVKNIENKLIQVIRYMTDDNVRIVFNHSNELSDAVNFIISDINLSLVNLNSTRATF